MSGSVELLLLRLGLIAIVFAFVFAAALSMRSGLRAPVAGRTLRSGLGPRFVVIAPGETGIRAGTEIALAGEMSIGRDSTNGIVLGDPSVSGLHATIERVVMAGGSRITGAQDDAQRASHRWTRGNAARGRASRLGPSAPVSALSSSRAIRDAE